MHAWAEACRRTRDAEQSAGDIERAAVTLRAHLDEAGLGHVSEVASGDPPHTAGGCPFQAWSLAALLRLEQMRISGRVRLQADGRVHPAPSREASARRRRSGDGQVDPEVSV
jgi:glycogen debranching enzyme